MATFVHPLTFGEYLALCFPLAMFLAGFAMQGFRRLLGLLALPLLVAGIYLSHTRSTLLALGVVLVGLVATLGLRAMRQRRSMSLSVAGFFVLAAVPIAALALGAIALELSSGRTSGEIGSSVARLTMFRYGAQAVIEQPLLGYGPGFAAVTIGLLPGFTALTVDSYYLSVALESGVPGLLFFAALLVYTVINGLIASTRRGGTAGARLAVLAVTLSGFAVVKLVLSQPDNMAAAFLLIALLFVAMERRRGSSPSAASFVPPTSGRPQGAAGAGHPIPR
jgi:O-antigen ligase